MIVGIVGFAHSGKDTVANYLVDHHGFTKESFAEPLKRAAAIIFDWPDVLMDGQTVPSREFREQPDSFWSTKFGYKFTPRMALQMLGTEACRQVFHQNIWIHALEKRIQGIPNVVVSDVRFPNEIDAILRMGGKIVRVKRGQEPVWYETALKQNMTHPDSQYILYDNGETMDRKYPDIHQSEWAWIGHPAITTTIENTKTIASLHEKIKTVVLG